MIKKKLLLFALIIFAQCQQSWSQNLNGIAGNIEDSHRPNASKGGVTSNLINVNPYTGTGSVNIPIHQYSIDGLDLGVSLGYNAKGIRVDEIASPVGLGWTLMAGGSISRTVYGLEDEVTLPSWYTPGSAGSPTYAYKDSVEGRIAAITSNFSAKTYTGTTALSANYYVDDVEYDVFNLNFCGRAINFSFKDNAGGFVLYPKSEIKIEAFTKDGLTTDANGMFNSWNNIRSGVQAKNGLAPDKDILSFVVTDEKGNKFYFEQGDYEYKKFELPKDKYSVDSGRYYPIQSWNLTTVVTATGSKIDFTYVKTNVDYLENITETYFPRPSVQDAFVIDSLSYDPLKITPVHWVGVKTHLKSIVYPNGYTVDFDAKSDSNQRCDCRKDFRLDDIAITSKIGDQTKTTKYQLIQSYFNVPKYGSLAKEKSLTSDCIIITSGFTFPGGINVDSAKAEHLSKGLRMKLDEIREVSTDGTTFTPYFQFEYNNGIVLPYRHSPKKDYYGYYNGGLNTPFIRENFRKSFNGTTVYDTFRLSIPYHQHIDYDALSVSSYSSYWGQDRAPNFDSMKAASLVKIKNGIGGETAIDYINYTLLNPDSSYGYINRAKYPDNIEIGYDIDPELEATTANDGLVVGKITSSEKYSGDHTFTTEYTYSGGQRFNRGNYTWYGDIEYAISHYTDKVLNNFFVSPNPYYNGSNHGFSNVAIITKGYNNARMSKTALTFSNLMYKDANGKTQSCMRKPTGRMFHVMSGELKTYRMGLLLKTEEWDDNDYLISVKERTYEKLASPDSNVINTRNFYTFSWDQHALDFEWMRPIMDSTTRYTRDTTLTTYKTMGISYRYTYDSHNNIKSTSWKDSEGILYKKWKKYNYDYFASYPTNTVLGAMNTRGMQYPLSGFTWKFNGTDSSLLSFDINQPSLFTGDTSLIRFPVMFTLKTKTPLTSTQVATTGSSAVINEANTLLSTATSFGLNVKRIGQFTKYDKVGNVLETRINDMEVYSSIIWDVKTGLKLAEAQNAKYADVAFTSFESDYTNSPYADSSFIKGNWNFNRTWISQSSTAITGYHILTLSNTTQEITSNPLRNKKYQVSYWVKGNTAPTVLINKPGTGTTTLTCVLTNQLPNGWNLWTKIFTLDSNSNLIIRGSASGPVVIDEVRLHPVDAKMTSWTYTPLFGAKTTNNHMNTILYSEYDLYGNLFILRDMRGNIITQSERQYNHNDLDYVDDGPGEGPPDDE